MAAEQPPRDAFITAIEGKIAAWKAVLDSYKAAVSLDGHLGDVQLHGVGTVTPKHGQPDHKPMDLPVGVFRDKTLREAIQIYLGAGRRKQTNKEIAVGLQKGGIATTATNFEATVGTALARMKDDGLILRFPDGWDLASSYPDSLRSRLERDSKPAKKARSVKAAAPKKKRGENKPPTAKGPSLDERILAFLETKPMDWFAPNDVLDALKESPSVVTGLAFARLSRYGKIARSGDGRYAMAKKT